MSCVHVFMSTNPVPKSKKKKAVWVKTFDDFGGKVSLKVN